jgi:hypothetical protein
VHSLITDLHSVDTDYQAHQQPIQKLLHLELSYSWVKLATQQPRPYLWKVHNYFHPRPSSIKAIPPSHNAYMVL